MPPPCTAPSLLAQDKLGQITARFLAAAQPPAKGVGASAQQAQQQQQAQQLESYIGECAGLLGLRTRHLGGGGGAREQLAEVLEAVVLCKQPDCFG